MHFNRRNFSINGVSAWPLLLFVPLLVLGVSSHWSYDEATTYVNVLKRTPGEIIAFEQFNLANNHVLNSLYFYWLAKMDVRELFLYRLPNLLLFIPYFLIIGRLLKEQTGYQLRHVDQLMLYMWPFLVYFAQGRGYAAAMVCLAGALLFMKQYLRDGKTVQLLGFVLLSAIGSLSIFSFLFPFVAMVIVLALKRFRQIIKSPVSIGLLALLIPVLLYIFDKGQVITRNDPDIIGRDSLFRGGTLSSLISFLTLNEFAPNSVFYFFKAIFCLTLIPVAVIFLRRTTWYIELTVAIVTLLLLVVSHYVFGAQYPIYRGAAYLILLLFLGMAYSGFRKSIFFTAHFAVIIGIGLTYFGILFWYWSQKGMEDVLADASERPGTVLVHDKHPATLATALMQYGNTINVVNDCTEYDYACFDNALDTAQYVICKPGRLELAGRESDFELKYRVATFFYFNKCYYVRKQPVK